MAQLTIHTAMAMVPMPSVQTAQALALSFRRGIRAKQLVLVVRTLVCSSAMRIAEGRGMDAVIQPLLLLLLLPRKTAMGMATPT